MTCVTEDQATRAHIIAFVYETKKVDSIYMKKITFSWYSGKLYAEEFVIIFIG